jgi:NADPH-dependent glutamate synthase beta subunit-like oxidoreductase
MVDGDRDLTQLPDLHHKPQHGSGRSRRPIYEDLVPPCNHACPAGEPIQGWLDHAQAGRYREAWSLLVQANPFPSNHGRVCYHPCESACNRGKLDAAVSIHSLERFPR